MKRLRASQKQHAINNKRKEAEKLANDEGAPVTRDLWESEDETKDDPADDEDDDDPLAYHKKVTGVSESFRFLSRFNDWGIFLIVLRPTGYEGRSS